MVQASSGPWEQEFYPPVALRGLRQTQATIRCLYETVRSSNGVGWWQGFENEVDPADLAQLHTQSAGDQTADAFLL